ncbi:MAG: ParA family protein [Tepidisphaeraceae bacterium]
MKIISAINAKGGCGKSTIAMSLASALAGLGYRTLLIDMDPQAQVTQWLAAGDGLSSDGTLVQAMAGRALLDDVIQVTGIENLSFIASSQQLEDLGRQITDTEGYATLLATLLAGVTTPFDFVVIDSPNQISPVMENVIYPTDVFVVPFESTKAVRSYANFFQLLVKVRHEQEARFEQGDVDSEVKILHVLSNLSKQPGLRKRVVSTIELHKIPLARTEVRTCGWLAQVDEHGANIFSYRPHSKGAEDMANLTYEVLDLLGIDRPFDLLQREAAHPPAAEQRDTGEHPAPDASAHYPLITNTHDTTA